MTLKHTYRKVFYHKILRPLKLWAVLEDIDERIDEGSSYDDTAIKARIKSVEDDIGDESTEGSILAKIKSVEDAIGDKSTEGSILARIKALEDAKGES